MARAQGLGLRYFFIFREKLCHQGRYLLRCVYLWLFFLWLFFLFYHNIDEYVSIIIIIHYSGSEAAESDT